MSKRIVGSSPALVARIVAEQIASGYFVGQKRFEESDVAEFVLAGQCGPFGQGVGQGAEFEGFEQPGQVGADRVGGCTVGVISAGLLGCLGVRTMVNGVVVEVNSDGSRENRVGLWPTACGSAGVVLSVARSSMDAILSVT